MISRIKSFVRALTGRRQMDGEMEQEWRFHLEQRKAALMADGLPAGEAEDRARREFGDPLRWKEQGREARGLRWLHDVRSDVQYALRQMRRAPGFAAVAIATLALGIGANTAIFSIVNGLLLRPLPVADPQRLVTVASGTATNQGWSYAIWQQIQQRSQAFDGSLAWSIVRFNLAQGGEMQPVAGMFVSGEFFSTLGVPALVGRTFTAGDDVRGSGVDGPVAVISYGLWQRRFAAAADVVGQPLIIEGIPFTVVGVTGPEFHGVEIGQTFDVAVPIGADFLIRGKDTGLDRRNYTWLMVMLRLKPDQTFEAAAAALRAAQPLIREGAMPDDGPPQSRQEFLKAPLTLVPATTGTSLTGLRQRYERPLLTTLAIVALVLTIGCANLANLLLARATARRHEISVRLALGASRWRLGRQLFVESLMLAAIGAAFGLVVAFWSSHALVAQLSTAVNHVLLDLSLDGRVLAFTALIAGATAVFFGVAPVLHATRIAPIDALKEHGRGAAGSGRFDLSSGFVVGQVALSLVLIVAAGLLVRTFARLETAPLGFDREAVLVANVNAMRANVDPANRLTFYQRLVEAVAAAPGVAAAGGSVLTPISGAAVNVVVDVPGVSPMPESERRPLLNAVTPRWFAAYGTPLTSGRDLDNRDSGGASAVVVVNEAFARRFFPGGSAVGETIAFALGGREQAPRARTIVGVVGDAAYRSLREDIRPTMYVPLAQWTDPFPLTGISIGVRSAAGPPERLSRSVAAALSEVNPNLAFNFRLLDEQVRASIAQERLLALVSGFFGGLALLLAALGIFGVTSYSVGRRRGEIGIRLALGAAPHSVITLVLRRVAALIGIGVMAGAGVSWWASQLMAPVLYGLEPRDPATLVGAMVTLTVVGMVAGWLPARQAARTAPAEVLRAN